MHPCVCRFFFVILQRNLYFWFIKRKLEHYIWN